MMKFLFILLLLPGCDSVLETVAEVINEPEWDHCDVVGYNPEACVDVEDECYGTYSEIPNEDPENNYVCCCQEDED